jgi:hypothetical protein
MPSSASPLNEVFRARADKEECRCLVRNVPSAWARVAPECRGASDGRVFGANSILASTRASVTPPQRGVPPSEQGRGDDCSSSPFAVFVLMGSLTLMLATCGKP